MTTESDSSRLTRSDSDKATSAFFQPCRKAFSPEKRNSRIEFNLNIDLVVLTFIIMERKADKDGGGSGDDEAGANAEAGLI